MAIINPEGFFNGDRLRRCSNAAQLHWPRLFLASDGFARLEINYARIIGRAYATFNPIPTEDELLVFIREYSQNHLLFLYQVGGQTWGQWDTQSEFLPRYKTAQDRRSPIPPEPAFTDWKRSYRTENKSFPKLFENLTKSSETFPCGVGVEGGVGDGKKPCASQPDARAIVPAELSINTPSGALELTGLFPETEIPKPPACNRALTVQQERWFDEWWGVYWLHKAKKPAMLAFKKHVRTEDRFRDVMNATKAQTAEMTRREPQHRPHGASWINAERWADEAAGDTPARPAATSDDYPEL